MILMLTSWVNKCILVALWIKKINIIFSQRIHDLLLLCFKNFLIQKYLGRKNKK